MRPHRARTPFHSLRSAMVAAVIVSLAAAAHTFAGGDLPAPGIMLAALALTGLASTAATRFKLNFVALSALLGAGQVALHEVFTAFSGAAPASTAPAGHHGDPAVLDGLQLHAASAAGTHVHTLDSPLAALMLGCHAAAVIACALLLAKGEAALWSLAAWLRPLVHLPAAVMPDVAGSPPVAVQAATFPPLPWRNLRPDCQRGPPAVVGLPDSARRSPTARALTVTCGGFPGLHPNLRAPAQWPCARPKGTLP